MSPLKSSVLLALAGLIKATAPFSFLFLFVSENGSRLCICDTFISKQPQIKISAQLQRMEQNYSSILFYFFSIFDSSAKSRKNRLTEIQLNVSIANRCHEQLSLLMPHYYWRHCNIRPV